MVAMQTSENSTPEIPTVTLNWTSKDEWGSVGLTHHTEIETATGDVWKFTVNQPRKGYWVARGWLNDNFKFYREDKTLKGAKTQARDAASQAVFLAQSLVDGLEAAEASLADAQQSAADEDPVPFPVDRIQQLAELNEPQAAAAMARIIKSMGSSFQQMGQVAGRGARAIAALRWRQTRTCACPTPLHTMRCGGGA